MEGIVDTQLHSSRSHLLDVRDVSEGFKPLALVDSTAAEYGGSLDLGVKRIPRDLFGPSLKSKLAYLVYPKGQSRRAELLISTLKRYPVGSRGKAYHREMGQHLGYPEEDIDYFMEKFVPGQ